MPTASHFAELSYRWGKSMPAKEAGYLEGAIAVSPSPAPGPSSIYMGVLDPDFQTSIEQLQEHAFRRAGHSFHNNRTSTTTSYLVYGEIDKYRCTTSLIGVEAHVYGAVGIYFREYTKSATIDELAGWWIYRALRTALEVHYLLGTTGDGHLAMLFDPSGLSDLPKPRSDVVSLMHGPFPLRTSPPLSSFPAYYGDLGGTSEEMLVAMRNARGACDRFAESRVASIRAQVLRVLGGNEAADAGESLNLLELDERLTSGRKAERNEPRRRGLAWIRGSRPRGG